MPRTLPRHHPPESAQRRHVVLPRPQFTREEKRRVFKSMVVGQLEAGFLRYSKRQELLRYADILGLREFDATLLIAEAQYDADHIEPIGFSSAATFSAVSAVERWSTSMRLMFAAGAAAIIDGLLLYWLFA